LPKIIKPKPLFLTKSTFSADKKKVYVMKSIEQPSATVDQISNISAIKDSLQSLAKDQKVISTAHETLRSNIEKKFN
jgi:hypothetical protein